MKNLIIVFIIFSALGLKNTYSQQIENGSLQLTDTCFPTSVNAYNQLLRYFIIDKTEINKLYKLDVFQLSLGRANFAYEQKISKRQSFELSTEVYQMVSAQNTKKYYPLFNSDKDKNFRVQYLSLECDYHYYYNINHRLKKGKNTNGFSANYFTLGFASHFWFYQADFYHISYDGILLPNDWFSSGSGYGFFFEETNKYRPKNNIILVKPGFGFQRKIGSIGYFDFQIKYGFGANTAFTRYYIIPELNIKAGFALSSLKFKR